MKLRTLLAVLFLSAATMATALLSGCNSSTATVANAANAPLTTAKLSDYFVSTDWVATRTATRSPVLSTVFSNSGMSLEMWKDVA